MYTRFEFNLHSALALALLALDTLISGLLSPLRLLRSRAPAECIDLRDQVAIVTGANTGIGRETALKLALHGAVVVLACRDIQKGMEACQQINEQLRASGGRSVGGAQFPFAGSGRAQFMRLDLGQLPSVLDFAAKVRGDFRRVDVLVNNAGVNTNGLIGGVGQLFQVNYLGHYLLVRALWPLLTSSAVTGQESAGAGAGAGAAGAAGTVGGVPRAGRVVNLSSVTHHTGQPDFQASALLQFSEQQRKECSYYSDSKLYLNYLTMEINRQEQGGSGGGDSGDSGGSGGGVGDEACLDQASVPGSQEAAEAGAPGAQGVGAVGVGAQGVLGDPRPVVALSVNPGAVRSDIWRHLPFQTALGLLMRTLFLEPPQGAAASVHAATLPLAALRAYQAAPGPSRGLREDAAGRMVLRADLPYVVPYSVRGVLAGEVLGRFAPPRFSPASLPALGALGALGAGSMGSRGALGETEGVSGGGSGGSGGGGSDGGGGGGGGRLLRPSEEAQALWRFSGQLCAKVLTASGTRAGEFAFLRG
ncbi:hypothetical protein B484DRAFT_347625 [Ochromonadaceae sp. CCMP2298]|nr:hypothetical protein B484DRAFT_347625 [Ochromonadaceae sp. CCMP2298]